MKHIKSFIVAAAVMSGLLSANAQTVIFNDTFTSGLDTVQSATPQNPTANSTAFEYFQQGGVPATPVLSTGDLQIRGRTTASSISGVQAWFTTSPVTLTTIGDWIELTITFINTTNIFPSGSASTLNIGLYNSAGSKPVQGVRLDAAGSGTGGAVGWTGYNARIGGTGSSSPIYTRPAQGAGLTNPNQSQDTLFNGASGGATYNNPTGVNVAMGTPTSTLLSGGLTGGGTYTLDYQIFLSAANTLTISNTLYSGNSVNPLNIIFSEWGTTNSLSSLILTYDAFALGWRYNSTSGPNAIDLSSITVTDFIQPVPEPTAFALAGLGVLGFATSRRFQRR